jgi:uncharacterized protein GlcG (DUF336 family)
MQDLTWTDTERLLQRAIEVGNESGVAVSVAILDSGRELAGFGRHENAMLVSIQLAQGKAYTACSMRRATKDLHPRTGADGDLHGLDVSHNPPLVTLPGGSALFRDDRCVGAIGVSGGTLDQDHAIASQVADEFNNRADQES